MNYLPRVVVLGAAETLSALSDGGTAAVAAGRGKQFHKYGSLLFLPYLKKIRAKTVNKKSDNRERAGDFRAEEEENTDH